MDSNSCHCYAVPPYILTAIAQNHGHQRVGEAAANTLMTGQEIHRARGNHFDNKLSELTHSNGNLDGLTDHPEQTIVPHYLLDHIVNAPGVDEAVKESARKTLETGAKIRDARRLARAWPEPATHVYRGVYDMHGRGGEGDPWGDRLLPGKAVRLEGQPKSEDDHAVNEAYENCGKVIKFYQKVFNYNSLDGQGMPVISSVHYGQKFGNAFWSTQIQQMVYGDGDGEFIYNFTACLDVIGHEMTVGQSHPSCSKKKIG